MPFRLITFLLFIWIPMSSLAQPQLSEQAVISVITLGPSPHELYAAFGHSAYRVYDPELRIDEAYNYGVFDFDQPNFYLNFARGFLYYKLGVYPYGLFVQSYIIENRYVHEQKLNLTPAQKQKLYDYLQWNALPENQNYRYDYFYNNCATKIRDVMVEVMGDSVTFDGSYIDPVYSIRDLTDLYLDVHPWGDLGIDICLGLPMDRVIPPFDYMFLPDYVESGFEHAQIGKGATIKPLVEARRVVYAAEEQGPVETLPHPLLVFGLFCLAVLFLSYRDIKNRKLLIWFDIVFFGVTGAIGLLLISLWLFTDHRAASGNLNILWALPTHLSAAVVLHKRYAWLKNYFLVTAWLCALLVIFWKLLPQGLNVSLIPVVIALGVRAATQYLVRKKTLAGQP